MFGISVSIQSSRMINFRAQKCSRECWGHKFSFDLELKYHLSDIFAIKLLPLGKQLICSQTGLHLNHLFIFQATQRTVILHVACGHLGRTTVSRRSSLQSAVWRVALPTTKVTAYDVIAVAYEMLDAHRCIILRNTYVCVKSNHVEHTSDGLTV